MSKQYKQTVGIRVASEIAKFLVLNAKQFRGQYEGEAQYSFQVAKEDKPFLDELILREHIHKAKT